jgi:hypothetical protein
MQNKINSAGVGVDQTIEINLIATVLHRKYYQILYNQSLGKCV